MYDGFPPLTAASRPAELLGRHRVPVLLLELRLAERHPSCSEHDVGRGACVAGERLVFGERDPIRVLLWRPVLVELPNDPADAGRGCQVGRGELHVLRIVAERLRPLGTQPRVQKQPRLVKARLRVNFGSSILVLGLVGFNSR